MAKWVKLSEAHHCLFGEPKRNDLKHLHDAEEFSAQRQFSELFIRYMPDEKETVLSKELDGKNKQIFKTENLGGWHLLPRLAEVPAKGLYSGTCELVPTPYSKRNPSTLMLIAHKKTDTELRLKGEKGVKGAASAIKKIASEGYSCEELGAVSTSISREIFECLPYHLNAVEHKPIKVESCCYRRQFDYYPDPSTKDGICGYWLPTIKEDFERGYETHNGGLLFNSDGYLPTRTVYCVSSKLRTISQAYGKYDLCGALGSVTLQHVSQSAILEHAGINSPWWHVGKPEEHVESVAFGVRPVVSLPQDIFVDIGDKYYDGSTPEKALKIIRVPMSA